ncbi:DUF3102 domain-containing protein [Azospirillum thermophilum]|uniref:DUF3102 domain-containing protein n=1 Tax=Azospirillum thermophilum TaxID=2202148 RepID=A0A2S2CXZ2_9PROT|nr:DUF3102 domain-containing protein [Azospirillum thermophilum]AWK89318.1 hypothetical protein DEW08_25050 [Azospirillum thermophilum]
MARKRQLESIDADELKRMLEPAAARLPSSAAPGAAPGPAPAAKPAPRPVVEAGGMNGEVLPPPTLARPSELFAREDFANEIRRLWTRGQQTFIEVGRYLIHAKARLPHGEFMAMVAADLPFQHPTANKLMSVARLVDGGEVDTRLLPPSSETCYQIATLTDDERKRAVREGVIRPEMRREDIVSFKKRLRVRTRPETEQKRAELARLLAERQRIETRIAALRAELGDEAED